MSFDYRTALIIGGSSGVGRELALEIAEKGVRTVVAARGNDGLAQLNATNPTIETLAVDAAADGAAQKILTSIAPDLLILVGGHQPKMAHVQEMSWHDFSATWQCDTKIAFEFTKAVLTMPLPTGSTIASFSSGAALGGSVLSGGYAGAKRMQHFLVNYGQREADRLKLGLRFLCIIPKQLMPGTGSGDAASAAYAGLAGIEVEKFMAQWKTPLTAKLASRHVIDLLGRKLEAGTKAFALTGAGTEALA